MTALDLIDKRLIHALNEDVRASYTSLAKRIGVSKEVVNYRLQRLLREGIIKEFVTIFGFGYWSHKILIQWEKTDARKEKEILDYLMAHPSLTWVTPCTGLWDLIIVIMAKDPTEFEHVLREIMGKIGPYVADYKMATSVGSHTFGPTYVLGQIKESKRVPRVEQLDFDAKDKKIALVLRKDARATLTQISRATKIPIDTVNYRIKEMERKSIIKRYRCIIDSSRLGFLRYEVIIRCIDLSEGLFSRFKEYARLNPRVEFLSRCVGAWDVTMTVHLRDNAELRQFTLEVKEAFGNHIKAFESVTLFETYNHVYFPKELQ